MQTIRWGIIGTGEISDRLVPDLAAVDGSSITAVWGRRSETASDFAARHGIPHSTTDIDALLSRTDVDAVYIATPIGTHLEISSRALDAGKHVLVEKPIATSAEEVEFLFGKATANGRFLMEAMWMKFNPLHRQLRSQLSEGIIGEPRSVRASFGTPFPPGGTRWSAELGGSTVLDQGIYPITLAQWILGEPLGVRATGRVREGVDVHAVIELEFAAGRFAQLAASAVEFVEPSASISGTGGWITIDRMFWASNVASLFADGIPSLFTPPARVEVAKDGNGFRPMLRAVSEAIGHGLAEHPEHDRQATMAVARTMDEIRRQVFAGASVEPDLNRTEES